MKWITHIIVFLVSFQLSIGQTYLMSAAQATENLPTTSSQHKSFTGDFYQENQTTYDKGVVESLENMVEQMLVTESREPETKQEITELFDILDQKDIIRSNKYNDAFLMGHQRVVDVEHSHEYALTDLTQRGSIPLVPASFKGDTQFVNDSVNNEFKIQFIRKGLVSVEHIFSGRSVVSFFEDASHVYTLESNGTIYAAPKHIMFQAAFKAPVPWVKVAKLNSEILNYIKTTKAEVEIFGATAGMRPMEDFHSAGVYPLRENGRLIKKWMAGDLVVQISNSQFARQAVGVYRYEAVRRNAETGLLVLAKNMDLLLDNSDILQGRKPGDLSAQLPGKAAKLNIANDLLQTNDKVLDSILIETYNSGFLASNPPLRASIENERLAADYEYLVRSSKIENLTDKQLEVELRNHWDKYIVTEKTVGESFFSKYKWHMLAAGGMATFTTLDYGFYQLRYGELPVWAANSLTQVYELMGHHLLDADYRWTTMGSVLFLSSLLPLLYQLGSRLGKKLGKSPPAAIIHYTLKGWALVVYPFFKGMAKAAGQPIFIDAMKSGISPFKKIKADSELGQALGVTSDVRVATGAPLVRTVSQKKSERLKTQKSIVSRLAGADKNKQSLAFLLGVGIAAKKYGIDVDVLYKAIKARKSIDLAFLNTGADYLDKEKIIRAAHEQVPNKAQRDILNSIDYLKEIDHTTVEIFQALSKIKTAGLKNLEELSKEEFERYNKIAEETVKHFGASKLKRKVNYVSFKAKSTIQRDLIGNSGEGSAFEFFWNAEPSEHIVTQVWEGLKVDYLLSAVQMAFIADRAWAHNPVALAADPSGVGFTFQPQTAVMAEQLAIHFIPVAADKTYTFATNESPRYENTVLEDARYQPTEFVSLAGQTSQESYFTSLSSVLLRAGNLVEANYPRVFLRSQYNSLRTIRAGAMLGLPTLMAAGLNLSSAMASYLYIITGKIWAFTAYWYIQDHSVIGHKDQLQKYNETLTKSKAAISQGIINKDTELVLSGYKSLESVYKANHKSFRLKNKALAKQKTSELQKELGLTNKQTKDLLEASLEHYALIAKISNAIESGDLKAVEKAELELRKFADYPERYRDGKVDSVKQAADLLKYSLKHPPIKSAMNENVNRTFIFIGAVLTTYLATGFFVDAVNLETNKWGLLAKGLGITAAFYATIFSAQFVINTMAKAWSKARSSFGETSSKPSFVDRFVKKEKKNSKTNSSTAKACKFSFSKANRGSQQ